MLSVLLLTVARDVWTKFSPAVSFRGSKVGQPKHKSSVDSISSKTGMSVTLVWHDSIYVQMSETDVNILPSVLHLNAVTARVPLTFFSTTSQSPSTAWRQIQPSRATQPKTTTTVCAVSPSTFWVSRCSWQEVWGPRHDSLFPAGQLPGHTCWLHQATKRSKQVLSYSVVSVVVPQRQVFGCCVGL